MRHYLLLLGLLSLVLSSCTNPFPHATLAPGFCAKTWTSNLEQPRGLLIDKSGDLLIIEKGTSSILALWDENKDGFSRSAERVVLAKAEGLNHGIEIYQNYLYATSANRVYRWKYQSGDRKYLGSPEIVVTDIPCCHHVTRSVRFDGNGTMFLQSGSGSNVDQNSTHSQIRLFRLPEVLEAPIQWKSGILMYDGLRNEIGLRFDKDGVLWGVENGVDDLYREDLGGDIHADNPSEEVNKFVAPGFYGYPYCWSEYRLPTYGKGAGTQWAHPQFMPEYTDDWCRSEVIKPVFNMQAHMAPMDIIFYYGEHFPKEYQGSALVSFHGSWNRPVPVGYLVGLLHIDQETNLPTDLEMLMYHEDSAVWPNSIRPVGLGIKPCASGDCIYVTSDKSGDIIEISYSPQN